MAVERVCEVVDLDLAVDNVSIVVDMCIARPSWNVFSDGLVHTFRRSYKSCVMALS